MVDNSDVNKLVKYYLEGWRFGYLDVVKKTTAWIRPIVGKYAAKPHTIKVPTEDVTVEEVYGKGRL